MRRRRARTAGNRADQRRRERKMAEEDLSPVLPRCRSGSDSEGELWLSLARAKTRSYGSTASVSATLGERYTEHRVTDGETLQGIALKYGVTVRRRKKPGSSVSLLSPVLFFFFLFRDTGSCVRANQAERELSVGFKTQRALTSSLPFTCMSGMMLAVWLAC